MGNNPIVTKIDKVREKEQNANIFTCKNLALIDEAEVEFGPGLNILTGETGAGKSILMGSVTLRWDRKNVQERCCAMKKSLRWWN